MKIDFFIPDLKGGGAQNMMINMANEFAKNQQATLLLINQDGPYKDLINKNVNIKSLEMPRAVQAFFALRNHIKSSQPDIIISALFHVNLLLIIVKLTLPKIKTKIVITERNHFSTRIKNSRRLGDKFSLFLVPLLYRFADKVIAISKGVAEDIKKSAHLDEKKVTFIHNPVVTEKLLEEYKILSKEKYSWKNKTNKIIITSGRLVEQKDYPTMLKAFQKIIIEKPETKLVILGTGHLEKEIKTSAKNLGLEKHIYFEGFVDSPLSYMKQADLFLMTSRWEGFCNVIVEALLCGLPIIATDCPSGPSEILEQGKYGTLVQVGDADAIADAVIKKFSERTDTEKQHKRALDFSVKKICAAYNEEFKKL